MEGKLAYHITMTNAVTAGGMLNISSLLLQDMQFSRGEHQTRFVVGRAGVSYWIELWGHVVSQYELNRDTGGFRSRGSSIRSRIRTIALSMWSAKDEVCCGLTDCRRCHRPHRHRSSI